MHELWLAPTVNGYYLRILDGWSGPVAFAEESTGRGSLTVAVQARRSHSRSTAT